MLRSGNNSARHACVTVMALWRGRSYFKKGDVLLADGLSEIELAETCYGE